MEDDDDRAWLDALAGRPPTGINRPLENEALVVRRALLEEERAEQRAIPSGGEDEARGLQRLLFQLRRQGLLERGLVRRLAIPLALAASLAVIFLASRPDFFLGPRTYYDEPPAYRGALQQHTVASAHPKEDAEQLARTLKDKGAAARLYQVGRSFIVDIDAGQADMEALFQALKPLGAVPKPGLNRIVFQPR
jgi:hypothetical protein